MLAHLDTRTATLQPLSAASQSEFLAFLGKRVREIRNCRGMTRKALAREADVSERHLAQLETGEGNVSILLLRRIVSALKTPLNELLAPPDEEPIEKLIVRRMLERLPAQRLQEVVSRLLRDFGDEERTRRRRIALIGLRGAGKSTLGAQLSEKMQVPFIELDREIEKDAGMPLEEIFSLYGQSGYRRIEKRTLERVLQEHDRGVISVGGGLVTEPETYDRLLGSCFTVWVKARPEEHMARVIAQGDLRPMADHVEAMEDLRRILAAREAQYRKADVELETSGDSVERSFNKLKRALQSEIPQEGTAWTHP